MDLNQDAIVFPYYSITTLCLIFICCLVINLFSYQANVFIVDESVHFENIKFTNGCKINKQQFVLFQQFRFINIKFAYYELMYTSFTVMKLKHKQKRINNIEINIGRSNISIIKHN